MQVCTSLQTDNRASTPPLCFLQAGCPSCRPTNSVKALKAHSVTEIEQWIAFSSGFSFTYCFISIFIVFIKCVVALLIWWVMGHA